MHIEGFYVLSVLAVACVKGEIYFQENFSDGMCSAGLEVYLVFIIFTYVVSRMHFIRNIIRNIILRNVATFKLVCVIKVNFFLCVK